MKRKRTKRAAKPRKAAKRAAKPRKATIAQQARRRGVSQNRIRRERRSARFRKTERENVRKYGSAQAWYAAVEREFRASLRGTPYDPATWGRTERHAAPPRARYDAAKPSAPPRLQKLIQLATRNPNKHEAAVARMRADELAAAHGLRVRWAA